MKKLLAALLAAMLLLLGACSGGDDKEPVDEPAAEEPAEGEDEAEAGGASAELATVLQDVATGMEVYYTENMEYPTALSELDDVTINKIPQGVTMEMFYSGDGQAYCIEAVHDDGDTASYSSTDQALAEGPCPADQRG